MTKDQDLHAQWVKASREQRAAYFAWQNASGADFLPALDAYRAASRYQREIEGKLKNTQNKL